MKQVFKVQGKTFRKLDDPFLNGESKKYVFYVKASEIPIDIPMNTNPREQKLSSQVAKAIEDSLCSNDRAFHLKNRGIVISAASVTYNNQKEEVTIEYTDEKGNVIGTKEVEVPVTVTPKATPAPRETVKTTPIVVEVGTPIGKDDVKKHVELPKGAEIVEVGEIPATDTAGQKPSVKVKVKLPSGEIVEVEVPVTVIPKHVEPSTPNQPASQPSTPKNVEVQKELPNTGTEADSSLAALGLLGVLSGFGLVARKKKED